MRLPLALLVAFIASPVFAADGARPNKPMIIGPSPMAELRLRPKIAAPAVPATVSLAPPAQPGVALATSTFSFNGLSSGGLRSGLQSFADAHGQCVSACSSSRFLCEARQEDSECQSRWVVCTHTCPS